MKKLILAIWLGLVLMALPAWGAEIPEPPEDVVLLGAEMVVCRSDEVDIRHLESQSTGIHYDVGFRASDLQIIVFIEMALNHGPLIRTLILQPNGEYKEFKDEGQVRAMSYCGVLDSLKTQEL